MHEMGKLTKTIDAHILVRYLVANFVICYITKVRPQTSEQGSCQLHPLSKVGECDLIKTLKAS